MIAATDDAGKVMIYHVTSRRKLATPKWMPTSRLSALLSTPIPGSGVGPKTSQYASLDLEQADASFAALFCPVWYEGYDSPQHIWQAAAGLEIPEPKFGMIPLIFGTLKATSTRCCSRRRWPIGGALHQRILSPSVSSTS